MRFRIPDYPKKILDVPIIYSAFQKVVGYSKFTHQRVKVLTSRHTGLTVIDLGCGPCDILSSIQLERQYFGIDIHGPFVQKAQSLFPLHSKNLHEASIVDFNYADLKIDSDSVIVLALGLLHHLSDTEVKIMFEGIKKMKKKIILLSIDPVFFVGQNPWSKFLANSDRGQYVREDSALLALMERQGFLADSIEINNNVLNTKMHLMIASWVYLP